VRQNLLQLIKKPVLVEVLRRGMTLLSIEAVADDRSGGRDQLELRELKISGMNATRETTMKLGRLK
jgi:hypothetical protein